MTVKIGGHSLVTLDYSSQEQSQHTIYATQCAGVGFFVFYLLSPSPLLFFSCHLAHHPRLDGRLYITSRTNEWRLTQGQKGTSSNKRV